MAGLSSSYLQISTADADPVAEIVRGICARELLRESRIQASHGDSVLTYWSDDLAEKAGKIAEILDRKRIPFCLYKKAPPERYFLHDGYARMEREAFDGRLHVEFDELRGEPDAVEVHTVQRFLALRESAYDRMYERHLASLESGAENPTEKLRAAKIEQERR